MTKKNSTLITAAPGKQDISITREFDAPRELVFRAHIDPLLYARWLGPRGFIMVLAKFEPRNGGSYRYMHKDPKGNEFWFHGVFHEVLAPARIITTFEFENLPEKGHAVLETNKFESLPENRTRVTGQSVFLSVADRDGMYGADMEQGLIESFERLDELLVELMPKE